MLIMNHFSNKKQSPENSEIIELDSSTTVDHNLTPEVICLDDSAYRSSSSTPSETNKSVTEVHRVRAEVDLTNELYRIKDYDRSDECVIIPVAAARSKRKAENEIEAPIKTKLLKRNHSSTCNEINSIGDELKLNASSSLNDSLTVGTSFDAPQPTSYALSVAQACLASLSVKLNAAARFKPYQPIFKGYAATNKLLTAEPIDLVSEPRVKKKRCKKVVDNDPEENPDCILVEMNSEDLNDYQNLPNFSRTNTSSNELINSASYLSTQNQETSSYSKYNSCDSNDSVLKLNKIPLTSNSSRISKNNENKTVIVIDDNAPLEKEKLDALNIGKNVSLPADSASWKGLRPIIIDGSNVAFSHGLSTLGERKFSSKGIEICINYFKDRGHNKVIAFVPLFRKSSSHTVQPEILTKLAEQGHITFTPSRRVNEKLSVPYDDRYIVQCAVALGGVIVSSDNYRDLLNENEAFRSTIENRLLMFTFIGDMLMFPQDPLGRDGPNLDQFLRFPE